VTTVLWGFGGLPCAAESSTTLRDTIMHMRDLPTTENWKEIRVLFASMCEQVGVFPVVRAHGVGGGQWNAMPIACTLPSHTLYVYGYHIDSSRVWILWYCYSRRCRATLLCWRFLAVFFAHDLNPSLYWYEASRSH
jgi:hypothetical protein